MAKLRRIFALLITVSLFALIACSKDETQQAAGGAANATVSAAKSLTGGILDSGLLTKLPASAIGFVVWETSSDAWKRFDASPWGKESSLAALDSLKQLPAEGAVKTLQTFTDALEKSGLTVRKDASTAPMKEGVIFVSYDSGAKVPDAGLYVQAAQGTNLKTSIDTFSAAFEKEGWKVQKKDIQGVGGLEVSLPAEVSSEIPYEKLYLAANENNLALSTSESTTGRLFSNVTDSGFGSLKGSPEFSRNVAQLSNPETRIGFGYFDIARLVKAVSESEIAKKDPKTAKDLNEIPVSSVAFSRSMNDTPSDVMTISLTPKTDEQKQFISGLATTGKGEILGKSPANTMLFVSIDGNILANAKKAALKEVSPEELAPVKELVDLVDTIQSFGLGIKEASGPALFPDIVLAIESTNTAKINDALKTQLKLALDGSGMAVPWQEKEISGVKVSYAVTPFVGVYVGATDKAVLVGTSETGMKDFIDSLKGGNGLLGTLSKSSQQVASNPVPLLAIYSNMERMASALQSMQGTLAMFSGGQSNIDPTQLEKLRKMGSLILGIDHQEGILRIRSSYEKPTGAAPKA